MESNYTELINLASERLGGAVLYANDDFFASKENLLKDSEPIFIPDKYTDRGKWMDGWESRRRRTPGFDWSLIRLGLPGRIRQIVVDTSFFRGNYPEHCSIEACEVNGNPTVDDLSADSVNWREILPQVPLSGDYQNQFEIDDVQRATHLRFKIYPDGGVARLRVFGDVLPDRRLLLRENIDLASVENGACIVDCSDKFFGHPLNLIMPGLARNMSEGWETKRRRGPGYDWAVVRLAGRGLIEFVEIDTSHFKGNYPDSCTLEGCDRGTGLTLAKVPDWHEILGPVKLQPHTRHMFRDELSKLTAVTHVRLNIFPDGGVSRLRIYGKLTDQGE